MAKSNDLLNNEMRKELLTVTCKNIKMQLSQKTDEWMAAHQNNPSFLAEKEAIDVYRLAGALQEYEALLKYITYTESIRQFKHPTATTTQGGANDSTVPEFSLNECINDDTSLQIAGDNTPE